MGAPVRAVVVASYDSFLRAAICARRVCHGWCQLERIFIPAFRPRQLAAQSIAQARAAGPVTVLHRGDLFDDPALWRADLVFVGLGNADTAWFMSELRSRATDRLPITAAVHAGAIFGDEETLRARDACELQLLNAPADARAYEAVGGQSGVLFGYPTMIDLPRVTSAATSDALRVVFAEQVVVPGTEAQRLALFDDLANLARRHPGWQIRIKPRGQRKVNGLHGTVLSVEDWFEASPRPPNLTVTHQPVPQLIAGSDLWLTVSSTAGLEAATAGCRVAFIADFGISAELRNEMLVDCGALVSLEDLGPDSIPELAPSFAEAHLMRPDGTALASLVDDLLSQPLDGRRDGLQRRQQAPSGSRGPAWRRKWRKLRDRPLAFLADTKLGPVARTARVLIRRRAIR